MNKATEVEMNKLSSVRTSGQLTEKRGESHALLKKILVPTDFSALSNQALQHAISWATIFGAKVHDVYLKICKKLKPLYEEIREITGYPERKA